MSSTSVDLPEPETPVTTVNKSQRKRDVNLFQVVVMRAANSDRFPVRRTTFRGNWESFVSPLMYRPVIESDVSATSSGVPRATTKPAMRARARSKIDDIIRATNSFLIVLDHQHRVAEIAQRRERIQQTLIVSRMQTDRRFVQNVKHAAKLRSDLRRQSNALAFAA